MWSLLSWEKTSFNELDFRWESPVTNGRLDLLLNEWDCVPNWNWTLPVARSLSLSSSFSLALFSFCNRQNGSPSKEIRNCYLYKLYRHACTSADGTHTSLDRRTLGEILLLSAHILLPSDVFGREFNVVIPIDDWTVVHSPGINAKRHPWPVTVRERDRCQSNMTQSREWLRDIHLKYSVQHWRDMSTHKHSIIAVRLRSSLCFALEDGD